jgi:hypothetical protein
MKNRLVLYAEAKLIFRESLLGFVNALNDNELFLSNCYDSSLSRGNEVFILDAPHKLGTRRSDDREITIASHSIKLTYCLADPSYQERGKEVADKLSSHLLSLENTCLASDMLTLDFGQQLRDYSRHFPKQGAFCFFCSYTILERP